MVADMFSIKQYTCSSWLSLPPVSGVAWCCEFSDYVMDTENPNLFAQIKSMITVLLSWLPPAVDYELHTYYQSIEVAIKRC